jgi:hypothetical protein
LETIDLEQWRDKRLNRAGFAHLADMMLRVELIRTTDFRSVQYLVHDLSDGAGAATASSSAAKTAKDIAGGSARRSVGDCSYVGLA